MIDLRHCSAEAGLSTLPDESVDLVVADFPYESLERHRKKGTTTRLKQSKASSNEWFPVWRNEELPEVLDELYRVLAPMRHAYLWCDDETGVLLWNLAQRAGFYPWKMLTWVKTSGSVRSDPGASAHELAALQVYPGMGYHYPTATEKILFLEKRSVRFHPPADLLVVPRPDPPGKGRRLLGGPSDRVRGQAGDVFFCPRVKDGYPTEKPVPPQEVLVLQSTQPGEIVLDPCMGSGSALHAAVNVGRKVIGFDVNNKAVLTARLRIGEAASDR